MDLRQCVLGKTLSAKVTGRGGLTNPVYRTLASSGWYLNYSKPEPNTQALICNRLAPRHALYKNAYSLHRIGPGYRAMPADRNNQLNFSRWANYYPLCRNAQALHSAPDGAQTNGDMSNATNECRRRIYHEV